MTGDLPLQTHPFGCVSAALAGLLGLRLDDVPDFDEAHNPGKSQYFMVERWLAGRGLALQALHGKRYWKGRYIACGTSPRGHPHAVVYNGAELEHDPHPEGGGIDEVDETWLVYPLDYRALSPAQAEREAVVKWLRGEVQTNYCDPQFDIGINLADAIERGDHAPPASEAGEG